MRITKVRGIVLSILLSGLLLIGVDAAWGTNKHKKVETLNPSEIRAALNDLIEEFQDEDGNDVTPVRTATLVVAASDSSAKSKAQADYVCDGVDDQVEIQAAIAALPAVGGKVLLLEGTFSISDHISIPYGKRIHFSGVGHGTIISTSENMTDMIYLEPIWDVQAVQEVIISDLSLIATSTADIYGIHIDQRHYVWIRNIWGKGDFLYGVYADFLNNSLIEGCNFVFPKVGIQIVNNMDDVVITNNIVSYSKSFGIVIQTGGKLTLSNNAVEEAENYGCLLNNVHDILVIGNQFAETKTNHNLYIKESERISVVGNIICDAGLDDVNNWSGIAIVDGTTDCIISGNIIGTWQSASQKHGVAVYVGCADVKIRDNIMIGNLAAPIFLAETQGMIYSNNYSDYFQDCVALSSTYVHAAITGTGAEQEITADITNPDVPRNISITNSANSTGDVTIEGVDAKGNSVSEAITIVTGGTAYGVKAFATVSKIIIPATVVSPDTIAVGISDKLGLLNVIYETTDVYKVKKNNADVTIGTVDATNGTVDCATITGADDFTIYYRSNLNIIS